MKNVTSEINRQLNPDMVQLLDKNPFDGHIRKVFDEIFALFNVLLGNGCGFLIMRKNNIILRDTFEALECIALHGGKEWLKYFKVRPEGK